jgi:C4-dicarboxylate-specific signal transduction histidine kinase
VPIETQCSFKMPSAMRARRPNRCVKSTRDFKMSSAPADADRGPTDVQRALVSVGMARFEIRGRARLVTKYAETPMVDASESQLRQVSLNLLFNAAQAIPKGDVEHNEIRITTSM